MIYLVEFTALAPGGAAQAFYFASGCGFTSAPTDAPADTVYAARIVNPGSYERHAWAPGATSGRGSVSVGVVELANADGMLDALVDCDTDGRAITVLAAPDGTATRAGFAVLLRGTIESLAFTGSTVQINLRDRVAEVADQQVVAATYGGTNVLPAGVDGTAADIKGRRKPLVIGDCENISPVCVNTSALIYQVSGRAIASLVAVWCAGAAVTAGVNRGSLAALQATAPAANTFDWCPGNDATGEGAYFRLGSNPGSQAVTAHAQEGANAGARTVARCCMRVLQIAGATAAEVAGLAAFDSQNSAPVGFYAGPDGATVGEVLDALAASAGASWVPTRAGAWQLRRLADPAGEAPAAEFAAWQLLTTSGDPIVLTASSDTGGIPAYQVDVSYARNWTVLQPDAVAGAVGLDRQTWLGLEYRTATATTPAVWSPTTKTGRNPLSKPLQVVTLLRTASDATAEATRLAALYGARRRYVQISIATPLAAGLDIGMVVKLTAPRFGFDAGRLLRVVGMREDYASSVTDLFCWC